MSPPNDNDAGAKGRAIIALSAWMNSSETAEALEAIQLLDLSDDDMDKLFQAAPTDPPRKMIPFLGKVR